MGIASLLKLCFPSAVQISALTRFRSEREPWVLGLAKDGKLLAKTGI